MSISNIFNEQGTIKSYNPQKGFGFIKVEGQSDVFFHITGHRIPTIFTPPSSKPYVDFLTPFHIEDGAELKRGELVYLKAERTKKGIQATQWAFKKECDAKLAKVATMPFLRLVHRQWRKGDVRGNPRTRRWETAYSLEETTLWLGWNLHVLEEIINWRQYTYHGQFQIQAKQGEQWSAIQNPFSPKFDAKFAKQDYFAFPTGHTVWRDDAA